MTFSTYKPQTRQDWLNKRSQFLGGSEIATILGCNPYQTAYQLWEIKTGKAPKFEGNQFTHFGHLLEDSVATEFENETGLRVIKASAKDVIYIHPEYSFLAGTPDRFYTTEANRAGRVSESDKMVLECKTTMKAIDPEDIPLHWYTQVQYYMGLTGKQSGAIAWLSANFGFKFDFLELEFDKDMFKLMTDAAVEFWKENILKDTPPEAQNWEDVQRQFQSHTAGKVFEAPESLMEIHSQLSELKQQKKELETSINEKEGQIKLCFRDAEALTFGGKVISTWKAPKPSMRFDAKALQAEMPNIYSKYLKETPGSRRFLLKV